MHSVGSVSGDWNCIWCNVYHIFNIGNKMKLNKYEKKFVRMMVKTFCSIFALVIIMIFVGIPTLIIKITGGIMLLISFMVKRFYWSYLEGLELKEKINKVI